MTPENRQFRATDAQHLLENKLFTEAFSAVEKHLNMAALTCDPDNKDKAQRIVISQQLLVAVKREIIRVIEDGDMAQIEMDELRTKKERGIYRFIR